MSSKTLSPRGTPRALAGSRIRNPVERLGFAVRFATMDLVSRTPQNLVSLDRDLGAFSGVRFDFINHRDVAKLRRLKRKIAGLQDEVRQVLATYLDGRERKERIESGEADLEMLKLAASSQPIRLGFSLETNGRYCALLGTARDMFLLELQRLLDGRTSDVAQLLGRCPGCSKPFVKNRKQKYCTPKCRDSSYWQHYVVIGRAEEARKREYDKYGWIRGNRKRRRASAVAGT